MKKQLLYILPIIIMLTFSNASFAGFWTKKQAATVSATTETKTQSVPAPANVSPVSFKEQHLTFAQKMKLAKAFVQSKLAPHHHSDGGWMGIASFVCALISLLGFGIPGAILLCIPAVVLGILGLNKEHRGLALAGLIIGSVVLLILLLAIIVIAALFASLF